MGSSFANMDFQEHSYSIHLRYAFLVALAVHLVIFTLIPQFEFAPYSRVKMPPVIVIPPPIVEVPGPPVEIVPADEGVPVDDIEMPDNVFSRLDNLPGPVRLAEKTPPDFAVFDELPVLVKAVRPVYPELSRQTGIWGTVLVKVLISENGKVIYSSVLHSDVTPQMERAALEAAMRFVFSTARRRTIPARIFSTVPITFKLQ